MVRVVLFGAAGVLLMALGLHAAFFGGGDTARGDARLFTGVAPIGVAFWRLDGVREGSGASCIDGME